MKLGWLITAHGYGHLMRCLPVLDKLARLGCRLRVGCAGRPLEVLRRHFRDERLVSLFEFDSEPGVVMHSSGLKIDWPATAQAVRSWVARVEPRERLLEETLHDVSLLVADGSPAAFPVASRIGVRSVLLANFTWLDQYRAARDTFDSQTWQALSEAYAQVDEAWMLPLCQALDGVPSGRPRRPVGLAVRAMQQDRVDRLREEIGNPSLFVGLGQSVKARLQLDRLLEQGWRVVGTRGTELAGAKMIPENASNTHEYLAACDACVIKPGWTSVAEALACRKPMLLLGRELSPEDDFTIDALTRAGVARRIRPEALPRLAGEDVREISARARQAYGKVGFRNGVAEIAEACITAAGARA